MKNVIGTQFIDTIDGDEYRIITKGLCNVHGKEDLSQEGLLEDILDANCILLVGANPLVTHPVAGSYILRAISKNHTSLILVSTEDNKLASLSSIWLKTMTNKEGLAIKGIGKSSAQAASKLAGERAKAVQLFKDVDLKQISHDAGINIADIDRAGAILAKAENTVIVYGNEIIRQNDPNIATLLYSLAVLLENNKSGKPKIISLKSSGNSRGAWEMGLANTSVSVIDQLSKNNVKALYILFADNRTELPSLLNSIQGIEFLVAQTSYLNGITSKANVILPSPLWYEMGGNYVTLDGQVKSALRLVTPPEEIKADWEILREISNKVKSHQ
jgi:predicted molibdopterin-dependent oxidoreductase YjgC